MTAYDTVDGLIPLSNPTVSSSNSQVAVSVAKPLPCAAAVYTVRGVCVGICLTSLLTRVVHSVSSMGCADLCQQHESRPAAGATVRLKQQHCYTGVPGVCDVADSP
jgi:hypothetical protein